MCPPNRAWVLHVQLKLTLLCSLLPPTYFLQPPKKDAKSGKPAGAGEQFSFPKTVRPEAHTTSGRCPPPSLRHTDASSFPLSSASSSHPQEEEILKFWGEIDAFQTSLKLSEGRPEFTFYDG